MTSARIGETILRERRMKLSLYKELNDPFELLAHALGDKLMRKAHKALKEHFATTKGVLCFSDNWKSPVMWAHYGEKHYGMCLGFDVPVGGPDQEYVYAMNYEPERLRRDYEAGRWNEEAAVGFIREVLTTKAAEWSYEHEWRASADLNEVDPATGFYYVDFGSRMQLREVILGARSTLSVGAVAKTVKVAGGVEAPVLVQRARVAHQSFSIVMNKAVAPILVKAKT